MQEVCRTGRFVILGVTRSQDSVMLGPGRTFTKPAVPSLQMTGEREVNPGLSSSSVPTSAST